MSTNYQNYRQSRLNRLKAASVPQQSGCIEYQGDALRHPYGVFCITQNGKRKNVTASRAMYMMTNDCLGLPRSVIIRHKCDNPRCINIEHLEPGTHKDNSQDKVERGRCAKTHRLHTRHRIHSDDTIRAIKAETGDPKDIAHKYRISLGYVSKLKNGKAKTLIT